MSRPFLMNYETLMTLKNLVQRDVNTKIEESNIEDIPKRSASKAPIKKTNIIDIGFNSLKNFTFDIDSTITFHGIPNFDVIIEGEN